MTVPLEAESILASKQSDPSAAFEPTPLETAMDRKGRARMGAFGLVLVAAATAAATSGPAAGDAEAIATLIAIDSSEIIHADMAMTKKLSDPVLAFVQDIRGQHADDAEEIGDVAEDLNIHPAISPAVRALQTECDDLVRKLDEFDGSDFEKAYLASMISGHTNALATINRLTQMDLSDDVKDHLKEARDRATKHLAKAKSFRIG